MGAMDPAQACHAFGGVATRAQLTEFGVSRAALAHAVSAGHVLRCARGIYAAPTVPYVAIAEGIWRGSRTCVTALAGWGLPVRRLDAKVHLAIQAHRSLSTSRRDPAQVRLHWVECDLPHSSTVIGALDMSSLCTSDVDQLAAIDAALNRGLIARADLEQLTVTPASRASWLRENCDPTCQSPPETFVRVAMREAGLPVRSQVPVQGVGRVDFVVDGTVVVEIDGKTYHMNERSFWEDRRRDRVAQLGGLVALRYTREDVERDLAGLVAEVAAAVTRERERSGRAAPQVRTAPVSRPWLRARKWPGSDRRTKWRIN